MSGKCTEFVKSAITSTEDFTSEFAKGALHSALIDPYNKALKLTASTISAIPGKELHFEPIALGDSNAEKSSAQKNGKVAGEIAGVVLDFLAVSKLVSELHGLRPQVVTEAGALVENKLAKGTLTVSQIAETDSGLLKAVNIGMIHQVDGTQTKVVFRSLDLESDIWSLQRANNAKIVRNLHVSEGFEGEAPQIAVRNEIIDGKAQDIMVQEHAGKSFGGQVRDWTAQSKGIALENAGEEVSSTDIAQFINAHPVLKEATATGVARKLADGGLDLNLSNWTIPESLKGKINPGTEIHLYDIDPKRGFGLNTSPTFGPEIKFGDAPEVMRLFGGKKLSEISQPLQTRVDVLVARYEQPGGLSSMQSTGLSLQEAQSRLARLQFLSKKGFPELLAQGFPPEAPVIYMTPEYDAQAAILDPQILEKAKALKIEDVRAFVNSAH